MLQELTGKSFTDLMKEGKNLYEVLKILQDGCGGAGDKFNNLFGNVRSGLGAMALMSNEGEYFNKTLNDMSSAAGLTEEAFGQMADTSEGRMKKALNNLKVSFTKLGESLLPMMDGLSEGITNISSFLSKLNPDMVASIAKFGAMAIVFGTVTKATGSLVTILGKGAKGLSTLFKIAGNFKTMNNLAKAISSVATAGTAAGTGASAFVTGLSALSSVALPLIAVVATLAAGFYAWHEYNDALTQSVTKSREEMSTLEKVFADLTGTTTYSKKQLEDMGLVYEEFSEDISPEFQTAVKDMRDKIQELNMDLALFSADGIWTSDETEQLKNNFNSGVDECIQSIKDRKAEVQKEWAETFLMDDNVIDEGEQTLLNFYNRQYDTSISEIEQMKADVNELFRRMIEEGYTLTSEDEQMIRDYYAKINSKPK